MHSYQYGTGWKLRYLYTLAVLIAFILLVKVILGINHDGPMKAIALAFIIHVLGWLYTQWRDPNKISITESGIKFDFMLNKTQQIKWGDILSIEEKKLSEASNGFGQPELLISTPKRTFAITHHLINFSDFKKRITSQGSNPPSAQDC